MVALGLAGQEKAKDPDLAASGRAAAEIAAHSEAMANLEYLCDSIGPRVTGSQNFDRASRWAAQRFRDYGLQNVRLEPWQISHSWARQSAAARIIEPVSHTIAIVSYGWTRGTGGTVRGRVVYVDASKGDDLAAFRGKLRGAIAILYGAIGFTPPADPLLAPYGQPLEFMNTAKPAMNFRYWTRIYRFLEEEGAAAILMPSDKPNGLLNMFSLGYVNGTGPIREIDKYQIAPLPTAYIAAEDYNLIWRLLQRGSVEIELDIRNQFSDRPVEVNNVSAEIPGTDKADELVILGAHLDSWDLGTGAADDGTGTVAVLEAARAMVKSGAQPRRTIRFLLFAGEEQGLVGSRTYVQAHQHEMSKVSGVLIHDFGTGKVLTIGLERNFEARGAMEPVAEALREFGLVEFSSRPNDGNDDHTSFDEAGVPAFFAIQEPMDYNQVHHSQIDTLDHVHESGVVQGAQVLATWAYHVAQLPGMLPRRPTLH
jgi:hypothetical protein